MILSNCFNKLVISRFEVRFNVPFFFIKQEMKKTIKIMRENILMRCHLKVIVRRPVPTSEPPYTTLLNL